MVFSAIAVAHYFSQPHEALASVETLRDHNSAMEVYRLAENEDFWSNMARYSRFFVSVMVGTAYIILKPFGQLLKRPVTAAVFIGGIVVLYFFLRMTLTAMLGLNEI